MTTTTIYDLDEAIKIAQTKSVKCQIGITIKDDADEWELGTFYSPTTKSAFVVLLKSIKKLEDPSLTVFYNHKTHIISCCN